MMMGIRRKRRIIAFCYHLGVVGITAVAAKIGIAFGSDSLFKASALVLLIHLFTFRAIPVSRRIQEWLIPEAICLGCGAAIDLVGHFRCGCGFLSYKESHIFSSCLMCGKTFSWVTCPECETSIPV